jgi:hypothetical protein
LARMKTGHIDLDTSIEINKRRQSRMLEIMTNAGSVAEDESPFSRENMATAQKKFVKVDNKERRNIQNIGSGTRCTSCGLLHFCWTPRCAVCGDPMRFNMGSHHS